MKSKSEINHRYSKALFELCEKSKVLNKVEKDIVNIYKLLEDNTQINVILKSQIISKDIQIKLMDSILKKLQSNSLTLKFVGTIANNGRLKNLEGIIVEFMKMLASRRGEQVAEVTTAFPITKDINNSLVEKLKKITNSNKVDLKTKVDKSLIGGLVLRVGSTMIDTSIKTKLNSLKMIMKGA